MTDFNEVAERYLVAWNEDDPGRRAQAVAQAWTEDGGYTDPLAEVSGHEAVTAMIGAVREQFPGHAFRLGGPVDGHHGIARFTWELAPEGADEATVVGFDVVALAAAARSTAPRSPPRRGWKDGRGRARRRCARATAWRCRPPRPPAAGGAGEAPARRPSCRRG